MISKDNLHEIDEDVTLLNFFKLFWAAKLSIVIITSLFFTISVYIALDTEEVFTSAGLIKFVEKEMATESDIENLLKLNSNKSFGLTRNQSLVYLQSREVLYKFFDDFKVRQHLFYEAWDENTNSWTNLDDMTTRKWKAYETYLRDHLKVRSDQQTKLINVSITDRSPEKAVLFINGLIKTANLSAKNKFLTRIENKIEILNQSHREYDDVHSKASLMSLIIKAKSRKVSAENNENFLFEFIDYPAIPEQRSAPNRTLMTLIGTGSGFIFSLILILGLELFREREPA